MNNATTRTDRGALLPVFLTVFIDLLGFGIVIPLLPIYSQEYGASGLVIGLLFSSFSLMQLVFAPFWGRLSDKIGRRPVLIIGLVGTAGSYVLFGLAQGLTMLFVSRSLAGFFGANVATAQAYVADVTSPADRAKGMGMIGAAFGLGFTFGPLIGGELAHYSMALPGFFAAGLSAVAAVIAIARLKEPRRHGDQASRVFGFETVSIALREPRVGTVLVLYFIGILAFSGFESMFIVFGLANFPGAFNIPQAITDPSTEQLMGAAKLAGRYMFGIGLLAALVQGGLIRRLVPRFGETKLIIAGPVLLGLGFVIVGFATSWWVVILGCAIMPMGFGVNNPSLQGLLSRAVDSGRQGAFLGLNQSLGSLARVVGPLLAGWVFDAAGPEDPFFVSAALLAIGAVMAVLYHRRFSASFRKEITEPRPVGETA
mgnify:CR=1 FL=1